MGRLVRLAMIVVVAAGLAMCGYWIVRQAYQGQPATDLRSLAVKACANPVTPAQRTDCVQLAAAVSADDSADLSRLALLLSLAGTIVAALGTGVVIRSLDHSRRAIEASTEANRIATEATEAEQRAWLSVAVEAVGLSSVSGDLRLTGLLVLANHGATPARDVSYCPFITFDDPSADAHRVIKGFQDGEISWSRGAIFPNSERRLEIDTTAVNSPQDWAAASVVVVVAYRTAFTEVMRFSALAWTLHNRAVDHGRIHPMHPPSQRNTLMVEADTFSGVIT